MICVPSLKTRASNNHEWKCTTFSIDANSKKIAQSTHFSIQVRFDRSATVAPLVIPPLVADFFFVLTHTLTAISGSGCYYNEAILVIVWRALDKYGCGLSLNVIDIHKFFITVYGANYVIGGDMTLLGINEIKHELNQRVDVIFSHPKWKKV